MDVAELLQDAYGRVAEAVHGALRGIAAEHLTWRADPDANTVAWLVWHLTRVQDDHVADLAGTPQVWTAAGWAGRFGLPFEDSATGYGQGSEDVGRTTASADLLLGYFDAVQAATLAYVATLSAADLDDVVDTRWDPPVTRGVRLVSVLDDDLQHAGQAAVLRGVAERS